MIAMLLMTTPPSVVPDVIQSLGAPLLGIAAVITALVAVKGRSKTSRDDTVDTADEAARQQFLQQVREQAAEDRAAHERAMAEVRAELARLRAANETLEHRIRLLRDYTEKLRLGYHPAPPPPYPEENA